MNYFVHGKIASGSSKYQEAVITGLYRVSELGRLEYCFILSTILWCFVDAKMIDM